MVRRDKRVELLRNQSNICVCIRVQMGQDIGEDFYVAIALVGEGTQMGFQRARLTVREIRQLNSVGGGVLALYNRETLRLSRSRGGQGPFIIGDTLPRDGRSNSAIRAAAPVTQSTELFIELVGIDRACALADPYRVRR